MHNNKKKWFASIKTTISNVNEHYNVCQSMKLDTQQKSMKPQYIKMSFLPSINKEITINFTFMLKKL
jgi:hypothetical protein